MVMIATLLASKLTKVKLKSLLLLILKVEPKYLIIIVHVAVTLIDRLLVSFLDNLDASM